MNRQKKKVSHSSEQDDQVSIFDSEQDEPKEKKSQVKSGHKGHKKGSNGKPAKNKPKKTTASTVKSREKKLSKDQDDIMKKLLGGKEEERSRESTESDKKEPEEIKLEQTSTAVKKEYGYGLSYEQWKDESNPYEEIPLLDQYSITKDNASQPYGAYNQQNVPNSNAAYTNGITYNQKYSNPYSQMSTQQQYVQRPYQKPSFSVQQSYSSQPSYNAFYGYCNPYQQHPSAICPNIDPSLELNFEDFQEINFEDDKKNDVNIEQIEQLRQQVILEKKVEIQNDQKRDRKFRKRRMAYILAQIQKLKKQYIELENLTAESFEAHEEPISSACSLLKQWRYDPNLLKKPEKSKLEVVQPKPAEQGVPKSKTEGRITMLNEVLTENPFLTQVQMADVLRAMDPVMNARIERSVVLRLLKICGFKKKKVRGICKERNTPLSLSLRSEYAQKYREFAVQNFQIFYFDELIINEYFDKESGWCKAEQEVDFRPERFIDRSVVVLAILSAQGTCKWNARFGSYQLEDYCKTFNNLLKISEVGEKKLLIVNPLPYRDPKLIMEIVEKRGWEMLVLPSDGLGLNPLQSYFADVRDIMKRKRYDTVETLFASVVEVLQDGDKQGLAHKMLGRVEAYVDKAMRRELL